MSNRVLPQRDKFGLSFVVMPLVRLMLFCELTWAEREEIAKTIQKCLMEHRSLVAESENSNLKSERRGDSEPVMDYRFSTTSKTS